MIGKTPADRILSVKLIEDRLGSESIIILAGPDEKSIRVFHAKLPGQQFAPEYYQTGSTVLDSETGSEWDFNGCAVYGARTGACLQPIDALKDYWFDWPNYHPNTTTFRR